MITLILEGIHCASCANKIEFYSKQIPEVKTLFVNFVNSSMNIELENINDKEKVLKDIKNIIAKYEPHVNVIEKDNSSEISSEDSFRNSSQINSNEKNKRSVINYFLDDYKSVIGIMVFIIINIFELKFLFEMSLYVAAYVLIGWNVVRSALRNIFAGDIFDENFLMFIATIGAFAIGEFNEAVAVMLFYKIGENFQDYAVDNSRRSIKDLINIKADYASKIVDDKIIKVIPEDLKVGDIIVVRPGEKIPIDGEVLEGYSWVDTSPLTGESVPKKYTVGNQIISGFINKNSVLRIEVKKPFKESAVAKILNLIENAGANKSRTEKFITKFARYYTPIVVVSALVIAFVPYFILPGQILSDWIQRGLIFLVVSCPCALVVSIPLGYYAGIGASSKEGILIKGGQYLDVLREVDTIVFDKTGTLTKGILTVTELNINKNYSKKFVLECAATAEALSDHPIANAITRCYNEQLFINYVDDFEEIPGKGIQANYKDHHVVVGNSKLMMDKGIIIEKIQTEGTIVYVAIDNIYYGNFVIADEIKENAIHLVKKLKDVGVSNVVMFTGDQVNVAKAITEKLGIDYLNADLLPQDKVEEFNKLKEKSTQSKIAFVGDGINDAPVLAMSDVGISMGALGSDVAVEASDVVLMTDEPAKIIKGIKISQYTHKIVMQNIYFALGIKLIVLLLGALGMANMWGAVFADVGVALLAVLNVSRIFYINKK
ncbi:MAG: heavy metal translocating P-type ATPase [Eubacteriaceae bacterium]